MSECIECNRSEADSAGSARIESTRTTHQRKCNASEWHCASFHKKIYEDLKKYYIDKNLVKFEHHAFPLDLAALNAEKIVRCASSPDALSLWWEEEGPCELALPDVPCFLDKAPGLDMQELLANIPNVSRSTICY